MKSSYDVVVAGGGPSGLQFAREVSKRSAYSVAVLEANDSLSDNDKSTGGTFDQVINGYDIPDDVIMDANRDVVFEGPSTRVRLPIPGYVLDFPNFLEFLGDDASRRGADIHTNTRVTAPVVRDGQVTGVVSLVDGEEHVIEADIVVDATGPATVLTGHLGFFDRSKGQRGIGKEYEVVGAYDLDSMLFRFDHGVAPGGYAWTFPAGDGVFKAGVCWVDDFYQKHTRNNNETIDDYVERWIDTDSRWRMEDIRAVHAGEAVSNNSLNQRSTDGFMAVGDAVSSINPLFGEGIRPGMESAEMAASVAISALDAGDTSGERLAEYDRTWNEKRGHAWKLQRIVGELLYDFDETRQDAFVQRAGRMEADQVDRLQRYDLTVRDLLDLYPFSVSDLRKVPDLLRHIY